ncbi:MAG: hypothetical protein ACTHKY_01960 [Ginsengibacter sp.]
MNKLILTLIFGTFFSFGFSQTNISPNILAEPFQGQHIRMKVDNDVEGTPLLYNDWKRGEVTLKNGQNYHLEKINFNASDGKFIYSKNDTVYEFVDNVNEIKIYSDNHSQDSSSDMIFRTDLLPDQSGFVQLVAKGKITILREFVKKPEGENYTTGIVNSTRKYVLHTQDVALVGNKVVPFKYSSSMLDEFTSDKKDKIDSYVKQNKLKPKKESDFLKCINFYNSISGNAD